MPMGAAFGLIGRDMKMARNKYYNPENMRAVLSVVIRAVLGLITATLLLIWLTGTVPGLGALGFEPAMLLLPFTALRQIPVHSAAAILFTAATMFIFLRKQIRALPWYKPLILNACLGLSLIIIILITPLNIILYTIHLVIYILQGLAVIAIFLALHLCIIVSNRILYKKSAALPEEKQHSLFVTILFCILNSLVYFICSLGIPAILVYALDF